MRIQYVSSMIVASAAALQQPGGGRQRLKRAPIANTHDRGTEDTEGENPDGTAAAREQSAGTYTRTDNVGPGGNMVGG